MTASIWTSAIFPALIGAAVGFMSGLLGKGGSAVMTPMLRVLLHVPRFSALASPLPATIPITLAAGVAYRGKGLIDWRVVRLITLTGIPATVAGSFASDWVGGHPLMLLTAVFILSLGLSILFGRSAPEPARPEEAPVARLWKVLVIGVGVAFLAGLLANSGGILFGPLFIRFLRIPTKRALATSLIVSATLAVPGTLAHWYVGHIDWMLVLALSVGSVPSSYLGARLAVRLRTPTLERIYGIALFLFGLYDLVWTERRLFWHE